MTENALGLADHVTFTELVNYLWSGSYSGHAFDPEFEHSTVPVQEFPRAVPVTQHAYRSG